MDKPRPNALYRSIAKDYNPKQAEMNICKYVQELEQRIAMLACKLAEPKEPETATNADGINTVKTTARKKGSKENG